MEARALAVPDAAWSAGIRYFDAARSYGRAESFLASWLASRQIPVGNDTLARQAIRLGTRMDALALAAIRAQPWADVVLSGAATVEQLKSNAEAFAVKWDSEAADLVGDLAESSSVYRAARAELAWN